MYSESLHQIGWFTLDNASNNKTMMQELAKMLAARDIPLDATKNRIMCFPHVVHLCVQDVIHVFSNAKPSDLNSVFDANLFDSDDPSKKDDYVAAVAGHPINKAREMVRNIRSSGLRRDEFAKITRSGNAEGWFRDRSGAVIKVPERELIRDVPTRWDSTFFMMNRLRVMRPVSVLQEYV